jgi:hypothetical protein
MTCTVLTDNMSASSASIGSISRLKSGPHHTGFEQLLAFGAAKPEKLS